MVRGRFAEIIAQVSAASAALGVQSPTKTPTPERDVTNQGQGFGYLSYFLSPTTRLSFITGTALNGYQIPGEPDLLVAFPISGVTNYPNSADTSATEFEQNHFAIFALQGTLGKLDYQLAYFNRYYSLKYDPDPIADLAYNGIADRVSHSGFINGVQEDTSYRLTKQHTFQGGFYLSGETLEEDNHALVLPVNSRGTAGTIPETVVDNFNGKALLLGVYAQDIRPKSSSSRSARASTPWITSAGRRSSVRDWELFTNSRLRPH
jgi:hypothetical protein